MAGRPLPLWGGSLTLISGGEVGLFVCLGVVWRVMFCCRRREHPCGFCPKVFARKEHLVIHVRKHTGETPFRCQYCPKAFARKDHYTIHVRQHTGETPYKCK